LAASSVTKLNVTPSIPKGTGITPAPEVKKGGRPKKKAGAEGSEGSGATNKRKKPAVVEEPAVDPSMGFKRLSFRKGTSVQVGFLRFLGQGLEDVIADRIETQARRDRAGVTKLRMQVDSVRTLNFEDKHHPHARYNVTLSVQGVYTNVLYEPYSYNATVILEVSRDGKALKEDGKPLWWSHQMHAPTLLEDPVWKRTFT
jgi:hypothetical protein